MDIKTLLHTAINLNASDIHLIHGAYPMLRINGKLKAVPDTQVLTADVLKTLIPQLLSPIQKELFQKNKELDCSITLLNHARFRVNVYYQRGAMSASLRLIPQRVRSIEELRLPKIIYKFTTLKEGLVLVTGPTGHGKTTSLAAMIEEINLTRFEHIVTIEDPIEYIYENKKSIISQREIYHDTLSWKNALKSVLREDPNIVLVGEMRDFETIASVLTIAETGHLVFATLHTNSASQTIDRIVDVFPAHQQNQVRLQLANTLDAVVSQRLLPSSKGNRIPVVEVLLGSSAVKTNIREGKTHLLDNIIQTSAEAGMISLENYMMELITKDMLSAEEAKLWCNRPSELNRLLDNDRKK